MTPSPRRSKITRWLWLRRQQLGSVERLDGSSHIKLARMGAACGQEPFIPLDWVASVERQTIPLSESSDDLRQELERSGTARRK
jgi:hypothetical protein